METVSLENIIVRKATLDDLPMLLIFEQGVIAAERPFDSTIKKSDTHYYKLDEMIKASHIHLVVAVAEDKVIGSGYARIEKAKHYLEHEQHSYLGFMYVIPEYRGIGVNKKIIDALKAWTLTQNIHEMRLNVYEENSAAISAYEKVGFSKHMIEMRIGLKDE